MKQNEMSRAFNASVADILIGFIQQKLVKFKERKQKNRAYNT